MKKHQIVFLKDEYSQNRIDYLFDSAVDEPSSRFYIAASDGKRCESLCNKIASGELSPLKLILLEPQNFSTSKLCHIHCPTLVLSVPNTEITAFAKTISENIPNAWHGVQPEQQWRDVIDEFLKLPNKRSQLKK